MPAMRALVRFLAFLALALPAYPSAAPFAYVSNRLSADVSVIDIANNAVVATIPVAGLPVGVAVNKTGTRVYVANSVMVNQASSVSVIDTATNSVVATVPVGQQPYGIAVNPTGTRVYVANTLQNNNKVSVIDTMTNTVIANIPVGFFPIAAAVNAAGTRIYVANNGSNSVSVIDASTNAVVGLVAVGGGPVGIAVDSAGARVYVANQIDNTVSVINAATLAVAATIPVGQAPLGVAINPAGTLAYVANYGSNNVSVIDTASRTVIATVPVGVGPYALGQFIVPNASSTMTARELAFTPLTPCRLVDTRNAIGALPPRAGRGYSASDAARIAAAGGNAAGCGIPNGPAALALTITAVGPSQVGNLVAYPSGTAAPLASSLNFAVGQTIANTTIVPITPGAGDNFALLNNSDGGTNVVIDAMGYFWENVASDCAKVSQPHSIGPGLTATVVASCTAGFLPGGGGCSSNTAVAITWLDRRNTSDGTGFSCRAFNGSAAAMTVTTDVMCCRRAGR